MTEVEAAELGEEKGHTDGWKGNAYDSYSDQVPRDVDPTYRAAYHTAYEDGQAAYRRTVA